MSEKTGGPIVIEREVDLDAIIARRKTGESSATQDVGRSSGGTGEVVDGTDDSSDHNDDASDIVDGGDAGSSGSSASFSDTSDDSGSGDSDKDIEDEGILDLNKKNKETEDPAEEGGGDKKTEPEGKPLDYIEIDGHKLTSDETISELRRLSSIEQAILEDEWLTGFIKNYANGVDPIRYIEETKVDYAKVSDFDLLKEEFRKSFDGEESSVVDKAWRKHLKKEYGYDSDSGKFNGEDDDDAALNEATLKREAKKLRNKRVEDQKQYVAKAKDAKGEVSKGPDREAAKKALEAHPQTKEFSGSGMLVVDLGEAGKFAIKSPQAKDIISSASDVSKMFAKFGLGPNGEVTDKTDLSKLFKALALAENPQEYEKKLIAIGRTLQKRDQFKTARVLDSTGSSGRSEGGDPARSEKRKFLEHIKKHGKHVTIGGIGG